MVPNAMIEIDNIGGTLDANTTLLFKTGRDLNVVSTTHSDAKQAGKSDFSRTNLDRVAGFYVTNPDGVLLAAAGRDVSLGTVTLAEQENNVLDANNYLKQGDERDVGTCITTAGDVRVQAGRDLTAVAATLTS